MPSCTHSLFAYRTGTQEIRNIPPARSSLPNPLIARREGKELAGTLKPLEPKELYDFSRKRTNPLPCILQKPGYLLPEVSRTMERKALVGLSGGVDSAVALYLALQRGYRVIGATLLLYDEEDGHPRSCCGVEAVGISRLIAHRLGVPYFVIDAREAFQREIIARFLREYAAGRTPNVCTFCNRDFKFGLFLAKALEMGAEKVITGHYARIGKHQGHPVILKGRDPVKDQSYFLVFVRPDLLEFIEFPLGEMTKTEVRALAERLELPNARRPESQEICFVGNAGVQAFLRRHLGERPGEVLDPEGRVVGTHRGVHLYTLGQRRGLGVALGERVYVAALDPAQNRVILGRKEDLFFRQIVVGDLNWFFQPGDRFEARVKVRHLHREAPAQVEVRDGLARVTFEEPQWAPAPGQVAAFYQEEVLLGGGLIREAIR